MPENSSSALATPVLDRRLRDQNPWWLDPAAIGSDPHSEALSSYGLPWCFIEAVHARAYHFPMIDWSSCSAVEKDPQRVSGAWVFRGTRVPVAALFRNLEDGAQLSDFLDWFPGVSREQARLVLEHATRSLEEAA